MKIVVVSDVHGNLPALEAVLEGIEGEDASELWCLGDLVGYNADPETCTTTMVELADICLAGNHDLVVNGTVDISVFAHDAAIAARWAQQVLSEEALTLLRSLQPSGERAGVELYHASPRDPVWEYVIDQRTAQSCLELLRHDLGLIGHSHVPLAYTAGSGGRAEGGYGRPTWCSTCPRGRRPGAGWSTTWSARSGRSSRPGCRARWPGGWVRGAEPGSAPRQAPPADDHPAEAAPGRVARL
jgi:predicted phosphodiesterase